jgi:predicted esterase
MRIKNLIVSKTARYFILGEASKNTQQVWFVCHGYGHLANEFLTSFNVLNNGHHLIVAPEGLHRFYLYGATGKVGASWMTKEDRGKDIRDYLGYLDRVYLEMMSALDTETVIVNALGFSQGSATASRWALQGKSKFHRLILWGGDFPADTDWETSRERLNTMVIRMIYGDADLYLQPALLKQQEERLRQHQVNVGFSTFKGGHEIDAAMLTTLAKESVEMFK